MSFKDKARAAQAELEGKVQREPQQPQEKPKARNQRQKSWAPKDKPLMKFSFGADKTLILGFTIMQEGQSFQNAREVINSKQMQYLYPLIKPICKLANAAVHQSLQCMKSPGYAKVRNADGKLTREDELGSDGKPIRLPSALDVAKMAYSKMLEDKEVIRLLTELNERIRFLSGDGQGDRDQNGQEDRFDDRSSEQEDDSPSMSM